MAKTQKIKSTENKNSFTGSTALFGSFSFFFLITSFLFTCLIFYHATLSLESQVIHDKANLYSTAMLNRLPFTETMSSENIIKIQNFIADLKSQDTQLATVAIFTKDGVITYSSTLGLIGDRIMDHWQDFLAQNPVTPEISGERDLSLFYPVPKIDELYLALTFKKHSFVTLLTSYQSPIAILGFGSFAMGVFLFGSHINKLRSSDFSQDPLLKEFEQRKAAAQSELNKFSQDLKDYETF